MYHDLRLTAQKIARRLELLAPLVYRRRVPLAPFRFQPLPDPLTPPPVAPEIDDTGWPIIPPRTTWGALALDFVLRGTFCVPPEFDPAHPVALLLPLGDSHDFSHPEALVYIDGAPYATADRHHQEIRLAPAHRDGAPHPLALHGWVGLLGATSLDPDQQLVMGESAIVEIDPPTRELLAAARTALAAAKLLDALHPAQTRLYNALEAAFQQLETREPFGPDFYASVPAALALLREGLAQAGPPLDVDLIAVGHAHLDVAWLWPLGQTRRKAGRTFHTVLRLMEEFPAYHFTQSQPQLYDFVRQDYPALFRAIQARVAEGRWEPIGGMWVEADCNLSGPESLARQFLLGRTFFREQFGPEAESPILWLPDVFGYSASLPQLIRLAGLEYFFTTKISWNQVNPFPYDSFWWEGIDGTRVLTHFSTAPEAPWQPGEPPNLFNQVTYNANLSAFTALGAWAKLKHKEAQRVLLMSYGYGDGGGGPTREMNENARELHAFPALPRVKQGKAIEFFRRLEAESGARLPTWQGELYLEIHRGTYTTQGRNKRANRQSEFLLHDAEFLATWATLLDPTYVYPAETFRRAWELVCLNQFHDILPGSSIGPVYAESQSQYAQVRAWAEAARDEALAVLQARLGGAVIVINPTGFERRDLAFWPDTLPPGQRLAGPLYTQPVEGGTLIGGLTLAPYSAQALHLEPGQPPLPATALHVAPDCLENAYLRVELNAAGDITRIYDKIAHREVLPPGAVANQFQAFEDRPLNWDAWDVDIFYDDKCFLAEPATAIRVVEHGPLRATLEIHRRILHSDYTQRLSLSYNSPRLDCETVMDWRERHILLKVAFPVEILAPLATYEIQWGSFQRPTHRNTSWDWARFESCAQKWVDLSEGDYGVALLNDSKYGHDIHGSVIRLSLLRSPTLPDPEADQGEHRFTYSLYPHPAAAPYAIAQPAYALNDPLLAVTGGGTGGAPLPPLLVAPPGFIVETIKRAEDGRGLIVRGYECNRARGPVTLQTGFPLQAAALTNLLEEELSAPAMDGSTVTLDLRPFQIVTLRLVPRLKTGAP